MQLGEAALLPELNTREWGGEKNSLEGEFGGLKIPAVGDSTAGSGSSFSAPQNRAGSFWDAGSIWGAGSIWDAALWVGAGREERSSPGMVSQNPRIV